MGLQYPGEWKFAGSDVMPAIPEMLASRFCALLTDVAAEADNQWRIIEQFKRRFGDTATSSELSWAQTDLSRAMSRRAANAPTFIDSLYLALEDARREQLKVPSMEQVNALLREGGVPFQIERNHLVRVTADAALAPSPTPTTSGTVPYQLGDVIGKGGFGVVHRVTRETSAATFEYAMKLLDPSAFVAGEKVRERFQREVRAIQSLQHRAIVTYVDAGIDTLGRPYLVMPLIKGANIRDATEGAEPPTIITLMAEVLHGLEHAHMNNVLHRDLKPSNILLRSSDNQPIILDFGTAFIIDDLDAASLTTAAVGSAGYIPPEVLAEPKLRTRLHDIYACVVITYELIARRRPNPQQYIALAQTRRELASLDEVLLRALGPADGRPPTAAALRSALLAAIR
jgi:serine/threonine protein kinase